MCGCYPMHIKEDIAYTTLMQIPILTPTGWAADQYALLDSGAEYKLERFGAYVLARPEPQAIWPRRLTPEIWERADATFSREGMPEGEGGEGRSRWLTRQPLPASWPVQWQGLTALAQLTPFKHTGIFPEQAAHWDWIAARIASRPAPPVAVLNLFGYTGIASLVAARAGARVTHLDAAPKVLDWAKEQQSRSGLAEAPIRWLVDDALKFVRREARRNVRYDIIVLDPPAFGRGPKGEVWKFETSLVPLLEACQAILSERPLGMLINSYSIRASALLLGTLLGEMLPPRRHPGTVESGELALHEAAPQGRWLSTAIFARWSPA